MYEIYADGVCIHSDTFLNPEYRALDPKLTLEDSCAGSLTFKLGPNNPAYDTLQRLSSEVIVYKEGVEIWSGRVINERQDFFKNREITCEGELAYLNDTTQPPAEYHQMTVRGFLERLLQIHNAKVNEEWKKFYIGSVSVTDPNDSLYHFTNWESTLQCINEKMVDKLGGHLRIRKVNGKRYLDYLQEYPNSTTQTVEFGQNLLDYTKSWDLTELVTVVMPLGEALEESPIEQLTAYTTVESVNNGSPYVESASAIATYGWIEAVVHWDDVSEPANLLRKARTYLQEVQFEEMSLEVTIMDLHYLNPEIDTIDMLDNVQCISHPHGLNAIFPVTKMDIPLNKPEETVYTLNSKHKLSLSGTVRSTNSDVMDRLNRIPPASAVLKQARDRATALINTATTGYITIVHNEYGAEELIISEVKDYTVAKRMWVWNVNGLGYTKDGRKSYEVAITMDGAIVANFITTGTMSADRIRGGMLESYNKNVQFDLQNGIFTMKKGSITLGDGAFSVTDQGVLTMKKGSITLGPGSFPGRDYSNSNGVFYADDNGYVYANYGEFEDLKLTNVRAENIYLTGNVYFARSSKTDVYFYISHGYVDGDGYGIIFNKPNGNAAKVKVGALYTNRIVCDGGTVIDASDGKISTGKIVADDMVVDGTDVKTKFKQISERFESVKNWVRENFKQK